jgi:WD40 repeat protein
VSRLAKGALGMSRFNSKTILAATVIAAGLAAGVLAATREPPSDPPPPVVAKQAAPAAAPPAKASGDTATKPVHLLSGHINRVTSVAYSPDGTSIATASWDGSARIWDVKTGKEALRLGLDDKRLQPGEPGINTFHQIAFSPDGVLVVTLKREPKDKFVVIVWNRRTGEEVRTFPAEGASMAISPDGRLIACGGYQDIRLYELATGNPIREIKGDEKQLRVLSLIFSPDGKTLISIGHPPTPQRGDGVTRLTIMPDVMRCWDVATGKELPSPLNGKVVGRLGQHIAVSTDGRTIVHANRYRTSQRNDITLIEAATGGERGKLTGHKDEPRDYAVTPDGRTMASGGMDGMVRLWDLPSGKELAHFGIEVTDASKGGWVESVAFSADGRTLVSGGLDKNAYLWDVSRITGRAHAATERSPGELDADWKDLAGDAAKSYAAIGRLVASGGVAVPFLGKHLEAASAADTKPIEQLIKALDDEKFEVRERATKELAAMGDRAAPSLRKALAGTRSAEAKQRLSALLAQVDAAAPSAETLREMRAVEALEAIGNPEARRLLEKLAALPLEMRLTLEAKASANRLAKLSSTRSD